jgi:predicted ferric reductase
MTDTSKFAPPTAHTPGFQDQAPAMSFASLVALLFSVVAGALCATVLLPAFLPELAKSVLGEAPKAYWYLSRSSAFVAFALMWLSMLFGLLITSKMARMWPGGPTAFDLHQYTSLLGLAFALFHALILMGDKYIAFTLAIIAIPFASTAYKPFDVGLGQIAFYMLIVVSLSFYVKRLITQRGWRLIHFLSFALFALSMLHSIKSGTDSASVVAQGIYWASGISVLFMTLLRILSRFVSR